jgi:hypothetical protein
MAKMVRKQVFITVEQNKRLKARAAATRVAEAELIRAGIDLRLQQEGEQQRAWQAAVDELFAGLSGAWAERDDLDDLLERQRRGWRRRRKRLGLYGGK